MRALFVLVLNATILNRPGKRIAGFCGPLMNIQNADMVAFH